MKRLIFVFLFFTLLSSSGKEETVKIYFLDEEIHLSNSAFLWQDNVMVPLKEFFNYWNIKVTFLTESKCFLLEDKNINLTLFPYSNKGLFGNKKITLPAKIIIRKNINFAPIITLRYFLPLVTFSWDSKNSTLTIIPPPAPSKQIISPETELKLLPPD